MSGARKKSSSAIVLVVGGTANLRALVRHTLTPLGYVLVEADDDEGALVVARREIPDLFIVDTQPPSEKGIVAATRIRSTPDIADAPIIALTPRPEESDVVHGQRIRVNAYLQKPFSPRALAEVVEALVPAPVKAPVAAVDR